MYVYMDRHQPSHLCRVDCWHRLRAYDWDPRTWLSLATSQGGLHQAMHSPPLLVFAHVHGSLSFTTFKFTSRNSITSIHLQRFINSENITIGQKLFSSLHTLYVCRISHSPTLHKVVKKGFATGVYYYLSVAASYSDLKRLNDFFSLFFTLFSNPNLNTAIYSSLKYCYILNKSYCCNGQRVKYVTCVT